MIKLITAIIIALSSMTAQAQNCHLINVGDAQPQPMPCYTFVHIKKPTQETQPNRDPAPDYWTRNLPRDKQKK